MMYARTHEVEDPVCRRSCRSTLRSHRKRIDLSRVQPGDTLPSNAEEDVVQEEERDRSFRNLFLVSVALFLGISNEHGDDQVTHELPCSSVHHHLASSPSLDVRDLD